MTDDMPDITAMADQRGAELKGLAEMQATYFRTLIINGFERAEAMELVHAHYESITWSDEGQDD